MPISLVSLLFTLSFLVGCATPQPESTDVAPVTREERQNQIDAMIQDGIIVKTYHMGSVAHLVVGEQFYAAPFAQKAAYSKKVLAYWNDYIPGTKWLFLEDGKSGDSIGSYNVRLGLTLQTGK